VSGRILFGGEVGRYGCQNDGLDEADRMGEEKRGGEGGREGKAYLLGELLDDLLVLVPLLHVVDRVLVHA